MSRNNRPKQFLKVAGDRSMIQLTVDRLMPMIPQKDIYIVTAANQTELVREHLPALPAENIIIEPFGMNTAPCIALSVEYLKSRYNEDTAMIVLPADHVISKRDAFLMSLNKAGDAASKGSLITFGIVPDYPATGYGYIESGELISEGLYEVRRFKEKPDLATARVFLEQGGFYWNSGMFCWTIGTISKAFERHLKPAFDLCAKISTVWSEHGFSADISALYRQMPRIPIDIGIMEKAEQRCVIPVDLGWSDVGSWKALAELSNRDAQGNCSSAGLYARDARDNYIQSDKFTAIIGVDNLCVIETGDAILIVPKDRSEDVKYVVEHLKQQELTELL
jgi:mannose-1-phosphate guanylyltransferase/mannose-6-phosphate isomerase